MSTYTYPVSVPIHLDQEVVCEVQAVAKDAPRARVEALALATAWLACARPGENGTIDTDRVRCGAPMPQIGGPHLYVISQDPIVTSACFPARIDSRPGERLGEAFAAIPSAGTLAVLFGCEELAYINTVGLTSIASHVKRLRIVLYALPESVQKVFDIVGLSRYLTITRNLTTAIEAVRSTPS